MKPEESLDVTRESDGLLSTADQAAISGGEAAPENKRRRLVRSAAALAPLVLTLRSGGVAAASCTGARLVDIPRDGKFSGDFSVGTSPDVCITRNPAPVCPTYPTGPGYTKVLTEPTQVVAVTEAAPGQYYCGTSRRHISGRTVAILSSASATSLLSSAP